MHSVNVQYTQTGRFVNSDSPLVPMVWLVLIENDVISMVLLVQNKFAQAIRIIARYNGYSLFYKPSSNGTPTDLVYLVI